MKRDLHSRQALTLRSAAPGTWSKKRNRRRQRPCSVPSIAPGPVVLRDLVEKKSPLFDTCPVVIPRQGKRMRPFFSLSKKRKKKGRNKSSEQRLNLMGSRHEGRSTHYNTPSPSQIVYKGFITKNIWSYVSRCSTQSVEGHAVRSNFMMLGRSLSLFV